MKHFWKIIWALFLLSYFFYSFYLMLEKQYDKANWYLICFFISLYIENENKKSKRLQQKELAKQIEEDIKRKMTANE